MSEKDTTVWDRLRAPFDANEIEQLPKPLNRDAKPEACKECGGRHGKPAVHLSYVGHAGITMRLNDVVGPDGWSWEPMAYTEHGTPLFTDGGLWIRLTVLDVTRIGYGDASGKSGPNAVKEIIGDAIRNAAMRFGVGTYLWSKSERAQAELARHGQDEPDAAGWQQRPSVYSTGGSRPAGADQPITQAQQRKVSVLYAELGIEDKADRHDVAALALGREVESATSLTRGEASTLIDYLDARKAELAPVTDPPAAAEDGAP